MARHHVRRFAAIAALAVAVGACGGDGSGTRTAEESSTADESPNGESGSDFYTINNRLTLNQDLKVSAEDMAKGLADLEESAGRLVFREQATFDGHCWLIIGDDGLTRVVARCGPVVANGQESWMSVPFGVSTDEDGGHRLEYTAERTGVFATPSSGHLVRPDGRKAPPEADLGADVAPSQQSLPFSLQVIAGRWQVRAQLAVVVNGFKHAARVDVAPLGNKVVLRAAHATCPDADEVRATFEGTTPGGWTGTMQVADAACTVTGMPFTAKYVGGDKLTLTWDGGTVELWR